MKFKLDENLGTEPSNCFAKQDMRLEQFVTRICKEAQISTSMMYAAPSKGVWLRLIWTLLTSLGFLPTGQGEL